MPELVSDKVLFAIRISFALLLLFLLIQPPVPVSAQSDAGQPTELISGRRFPWYDSNLGELKRLDSPDGNRARTLDRHAVPKYRPKKKKTTNANGPAPPAPNWNPGSLFEFIAWLVISLFFIGIVALLIWVFLKMERRSASGTEEAAEADRSFQGRIRQLPFELRQDLQGDLRRLARAAADQGEYGRAMMALFSHVLLDLDRNGLIRLRKGKTNRQYLRELGRQRDLSLYYKRVMVPFEASFFGDHKVARETFEFCWDELSKFDRKVATVAEGGVS